MITFAYKGAMVLWLLPFIVRMLFPALKNGAGDALRVPFLADFARIDKEVGSACSAADRHGFSKAFLGFMAVWSLLTLAAMRPIRTDEPIRLQTQGRDILLVTDISTSMQEKDFAYQGRRLDRLTAVKAVVSDFASRRLSDRLGLILFGTRAYLQVPLTYDRTTLEDVLQSALAGMAGDSTAIGDALGLAVKTLRQDVGSTDQKVVILLTDGENNDGSMSVPQALDMARREKIKIYTIGVGQGRESLLASFFGQGAASFDDTALKKLAAETGGRYFRASDVAGLAQVYREIDSLEPESKENNLIYPKTELFYLPLAVALLLAVWGMVYLRRIV